MSPSSSVGGPATLKLTTGPNSGSSSLLTTHATPGVAIFCTTNALAASGARRSLRPENAALTSLSVPRSTRMPPMPGWWRSSGATDLMTTG